MSDEVKLFVDEEGYLRAAQPAASARRVRPARRVVNFVGAGQPLPPDSFDGQTLVTYVMRENAVYIEAACDGDMDTVKAELERGLPVDARSEDYCMRTALIEASREGHIELVRYLLAQGADKSLTDSVHGNSARDMALSNGHDAVARLLE